jgi:hypothetical protein
MKQYIYDLFLTKLDDIDNIIKLIDSLSEGDKKEFLKELMKKCEFSKDEFYSNSENKKIKLLCYLNERSVISAFLFSSFCSSFISSFSSSLIASFLP